MPSAALRLRGVQPVESHEVVEALAEQLRGDEPFVHHIGGGSATVGATRLHAHLVPLRATDGAEADAAPVWALLREMGTVGARSTTERPSGLVTVSLQLQISLDPDQLPGHVRPFDVLSYGHVLAWRALQGGLLDVTDGSGRFQSTAQVTRTERPSPARLDDAGRLYSSAYFSASVRPL